jgi:LuxR family transcriptional regulator, maltose regulon positive regulatory protein
VGDLVARTALVNRLRASAPCPVVTLAAPAGYGKTTLLAEWSRRDERRFTTLTPATLERELAGAHRAEGTVFALDDVDRLTDPRCVRLLAQAVDDLPEGSQLAFAGRALPLLPFARLRAEGRLFELGAGELAFTEREAAALGRAIDDTEGWPVALRSSAQELDAYLEREVLSQLSAGDARLLSALALPDRVCGPLADAMLRRSGCGRRLEAFERANLFLFPLDRTRTWYRFHRLVRRRLRAVLERHALPELHRRAGEWLEAAGDLDAAVSHFDAAGLTDRVAALVTAEHLPADPLHDGHPALTAYGALGAALDGRATDAEELAATLERSTYRGPMPDGSESPRGWKAFVRALLCREGLARMSADADLAVATLARESPLRPHALLLAGVARLAAGDGAGADGSLAEAADTAHALRLPGVAACALAERALAAPAQADELVRRALETSEQAGLGDHVHAALGWAVNARASLRRAEWQTARRQLGRAVELLPLLTEALPWYAVQVRIEVGRALLALADRPAAAAVVAEADELLAHVPELGVLVGQVDELRRELATAPRDAGRLTPGELRLLPLLPTHRSYREIAEQLGVSRNTVKTQAISVYRKLGVSSRGEAIARAAELGLGLDHPVRGMRRAGARC